MLSYQQAEEYSRGFYETKKLTEDPGVAYSLVVYRLQEWRSQGQISDQDYRKLIENLRPSRTTGIDYRKDLRSLAKPVILARMEQIGIQKISTEALEVVERRVAKLNKRATKLGLSSFLSLQVSDPFVEDAIECVNVELQGEMPVLAGYSFMATLEHVDSNEVMVRRMPGSDESIDLTVYRTADPLNCDHCGHRRQRKDTYVVADETGVTSQVGSSCLADFLGHSNPLAYAHLIGEVSEVFEGMPKGERLIHTLEYVTHVALMIGLHGWVSGDRAFQMDIESTKNAAMTNMINMQIRKHHSRTGQPLWTVPTPSDAELAEKALEWIRELPESDRESEYMHNLYVACKGDWMTHRRAGFVSSLVAAFQREEVKRAEREGVQTSEFEGTEKTREKFIFEVTKVTSYDHPDYGMQHTHVLTSSAGNTLVWRTSANLLDRGATYEGAFRVEAHIDHPRFGKQTKLTRPSKDLKKIS